MKNNTFHKAKDVIIFIIYFLIIRLGFLRLYSLLALKMSLNYNINFQITNELTLSVISSVLSLCFTVYIMRYQINFKNLNR